jgi:hypothetical protein
LNNGRGDILYRKDSFRQLLKNDSLRHVDNGMKEVFDDIQKYSIVIETLINSKL